MPEAGFAVALTGRIAEYQTILNVLDEAAGITVLSCVPLSGTSALLATAAEEAHQPVVIADARRCRDALDLAMAIGDAAVRVLAPEAASWWVGTSGPQSTEGLRLSRTLGGRGIDTDELRLGGGRPLQRLDEALQVVQALADGPVTVVVDHLGPLLWQEGTDGTRALLGQVRAAWQDSPTMSLVLVDFPGGPTVTAIADRGHPLYHAGDVIQIGRPEPQRFVDDLAITRPTTAVPVALLRGCADLAGGVPAHTWRAIELADRTLPSPAAAVSGWRAVRDAAEPVIARHWDTLRRVHPLAQSVTAAVASGLRPHTTIAANDKSIGDATRVMRALGLAWQPEPRRWAVADPLLAAYARDVAPPWIERRRERPRDSD